MGIPTVMRKPAVAWPRGGAVRPLPRFFGGGKGAPTSFQIVLMGGASRNRGGHKGRRSGNRPRSTRMKVAAGEAKRKVGESLPVP